VLPCASWYRATPNGTKALAASATGGLGRFLLPCASWHGPLFYVPRRLQPDAIGGLDRNLLPCASWPSAKALGANISSVLIIYHSVEIG